ncbi:MAG: hypothetical protein WCI17_08850, partial [bacterium]
MSLIEDALRKQESEGGHRLRPGPPAASDTNLTAAPAPAASPPQTFSRPVRRPSGMARPSVVARPGLHPDVMRQRHLARMVAGGVALLALLAGGATLLVWSGRKQAPNAAPATPATEPAEMKAAHPGVIAAAEPALAMPVPAIPTGPSSAATSSPPEMLRTSAAPVAPVAAVSLPLKDGLLPDVPVVPPAPAAASAPAPLPEPPAVIWPEILVKGMFSSGGKTLVLLGDGSTLEAGAPAPSGVRLKDAGPGWVRVAYRGQ